MWATSVTEKLPKVNTHSIGENSPNLVTLLKKRLARKPRFVRFIDEMNKKDAKVVKNSVTRLGEFLPFG
jgi:hypothetical protein